MPAIEPRHAAVQPDDPAPRRADFPVLRPMPTRWADNDHYGHVNNVVYYSYFDTAVNGWLIEVCGTDIRTLSAVGVVAETSCRFLRELSFPDQLEVGLAVARVGRSSVTYELAVFAGDDDEPAAVGRFVHVYVDPGTRRPVALPDIVRAAVEPVRRPSAREPMC